MQYKQILLATDLSTNSEKVAQRAKKIATACKAKLNIVHVIEHSPIAYGGEFSIPVDANLEQSIEAQALKSLDSLSEKLKISGKHRHLESGSVKHVVINLAQSLKADLIIVGSHGHHGIEKLLGSRANAILHVAGCDVLAIRTDEPS